MFKRLLAPAIVIACAGLAIAQPATGNKQPDKKETVPGKTIQPGKETKKETPAAPAADASLKAGSPAPAITVDKWIKGQAVTGFEKGRVYVVEFWATWCGPCKTIMPHMTALQKTHKDVVFMSIASSEKLDGDGKDNRLKNLETFVKKQGDKMGYTIGYDPDRKMSKAWMSAAGQGYIPTAFIVDGTGKIAWIGSPGPNPDAVKTFESELEKAIKSNKSAPAHTEKEEKTTKKQEKQDPKDVKKEEKKEDKK